jgi:hypothetical protein
MANQEVTLMKGNEAIAHACIRCGADGFFGYPITPQSEIIETLALLKPWETSGMVVLQAESEVAAINMVYGGAGAGKRVITTSSSPGVALMQEGISYMAGAEIPGVIVNVQRGGPGLGTIQPSQSDYFQATRGGGNGDYNVIVLAPASVQEMADFVDLAFTLAFKYRNPAMILSDGVIGQMMEKVVLPPVKPRRTEEEIAKECPWATIGRPKSRPVNIMTSLELKPEATAVEQSIDLDWVMPTKMPSKTNADMPDSGISTAHQKYSPDAAITCLSLVSKERKFSPPTIYNKVKPTATTAPKPIVLLTISRNAPHVSGSIILAAQRLCRIGKTIHKIREDGKERHQQRIHSQHDGTLPGTCRRKEEVDCHQTEGAEKDILIEREKLLQRFGSKEMPAIVILA